MKSLPSHLLLALAVVARMVHAAPGNNYFPPSSAHQGGRDEHSVGHLGHTHHAGHITHRNDQVAKYTDDQSPSTYCVICASGPSGKWSEDQCKIYLDQHGFRDQYIIHCQEYFIKQHPGDWSEQDCKSYHNQWKGGLNETHSHPAYVVQCRKYHGILCDNQCEPQGPELWTDERCKTYWDGHSKDGFTGDYAVHCKLWHEKFHGCTDNCDIVWTDERCQMFWDGRLQEGYQGGFAIYCRVWYDNHYGCKDGCSDQRGATGKWTDEKCKSHWDQYSKDGFKGEYAVYCREYHQKTYNCTDDCEGPPPSSPAKWTDDKCKAYWDQYSKNGVTGDYATYCKEYHERVYGKHGADNEKDDGQVNCADAKYAYHKSCRVVVSGASATFSMAGGLAIAALTVFAFC